jgi:uncharacterized protein YecE (DUF72 family)
MTQSSAAIRVGIGGWNFEPWRETFYPPGLPASRELQYASSKLSAIEVNGTYYSSQKPATFAKWRSETPEGFVFSLKASRFATNRRVLGEAGESVQRFVGSGIAELGDKLGPIVWQFAPTKRFDPADFEAFLKLLPAEVAGLPLRHVMDVRHESFKVPEYLALARRYRAATVFTDSDDYPSFADLTADFVYTRMMRTHPHDAHRLQPGARRHPRSARPAGSLRAGLARRLRAGGGAEGGAAHRPGRAARRLHVLHQRCQGEGTPGRHGLAGADRGNCGVIPATCFRL